MDDFERGILNSYKALQRYAHTLTRKVSAAEDLVQETMLRALKNRAQFKPGTNLDAWLFTITRNIHYSSWRKGKHHEEWVHEEQIHGKGVMGPDQESAVEFKQTMDRLNDLSLEHRRAVMLMCIKQLSHEEAAQIEQVAVGTIKSRLARARVILAKEPKAKPVKKPQLIAPPTVRGKPLPSKASNPVFDLFQGRATHVETRELIAPDLSIVEIQIIHLAT